MHAYVIFNPLKKGILLVGEGGFEAGTRVTETCYSESEARASRKEISLDGHTVVAGRTDFKRYNEVN